MVDHVPKEEEDILTVAEMQGWLKDEIRDSAKAFELRVREAKEFVSAYSHGKISPEEAMEHLFQYDARWGEALYGATVGLGSSDETIVKAIDNARHESLYPEKISHTDKIKRRPAGSSGKAP